MLVKKVQKKLDEYGLSILNNYEIEETNENEYVFIIKEALILVRKKEQSISLSFQATTKPERAANLVLIINEIKKCNIFIMESFIFDKNYKFISGEGAYKLIQDTNIEVAKNKLCQEQAYIQILQHEKGFEC